MGWSFVFFSSTNANWPQSWKNLGNFFAVPTARGAAIWSEQGHLECLPNPNN